MRFMKVGDLEIVTRITGPTHHLLGMVLSPDDIHVIPVIERVSLDHPQAEAEPFDPESDLCREVLTAVQDTNDRLGTHFGVTRIRYCADDRPVAGVYRRLAEALVEHAISEQEASLQPSLGQLDGRHEQLSS